MPKNRGYLLPENLEPENDRCFVVYVPDEPEYILALMGSLSGLEKWNVWERTGDTSGSIAAHRWKKANQRTFDASQVVDCQFLEDLLEDGDMSVNITNNISCGECGGSGSGCQCFPTTVSPSPDTHAPQEFYDDAENAPEQFDPIDT